MEELSNGGQEIALADALTPPCLCLPLRACDDTAMPANVPHPRSMRLKGHDYSQSGAYFVTLVTEYRLCLLGLVVGGEMHVSPLRRMIQDVWTHLPHHYSDIQLDVHMTMPNHLLQLSSSPATTSERGRRARSAFRAGFKMFTTREQRGRGDRAMADTPRQVLVKDVSRPHHSERARAECDPRVDCQQPDAVASGSRKPRPVSVAASSCLPSLSHQTRSFGPPVRQAGACRYKTCATAGVPRGIRSGNRPQAPWRRRAASRSLPYGWVASDTGFFFG
jgi:hypothetical protein